MKSKPNYNEQDTSVTAANITYKSWKLNAGNCTQWLIRKQDTTTGIETTWVKGATGYAVAWTGRATLTYSKEIVTDGDFF